MTLARDRAMGPEAPLVSVVMSTHDRTDYLRSSIRAVLEQDLRDFELIIVDDHSPVDPGPMVASFGDPRIRYLRQGRNVGIARNVTTGMRAATGRYVTNVHDDDLVDHDYLSTLVLALQSQPDSVLAFADHRVIDSTGAELPDETERRSRAEGRAAMPSGVLQPFIAESLVQRAVFLGLGCLWRNGLVDWDRVADAGDHWDNFTLYLLGRNGGAAVYLSRRIASWRLHADSNTIKGSGHRADQATKIRTGLSTVHCFSTYLRDPRLQLFHPVFRREVASGHASVAVGRLRQGNRRAARAAALASLRVAPTARGAVALLIAMLPPRLARCVSRTIRR